MFNGIEHSSSGEGVWRFPQTPTPFCKELLYIDLEHLFEYNCIHKQFVEFGGVNMSDEQSIKDKIIEKINHISNINELIYLEKLLSIILEKADN